METIAFEKDIKVFYVTAKSFPEGIMAAHEKIHGLAPMRDNRKYFGISRPENGRIVYRAAASEILANEAEKLKLELLNLKRGKYISMTVENYQKNLPAIEKTFNELLSKPGLDPEGYCVEWYYNDKDVKCMIRLQAND